MTRQHFEAIAATLASIRPDRGNRYASKAVQAKGLHKYEQWSATVRAFAVTLAQFNAGFQPARFFKACGLEE